MKARRSTRGGLIKAAVLFLMLLALLPLAFHAAIRTGFTAAELAGQAVFVDERAADYKLSTGTNLWDVPMTQHAATSHAKQTWNATTIRQRIASGQCRPHEYLCADQEVRIVWCVLDNNPNLAVGLVIGATIEQIITGFAAPVETWRNRCP